MDERTNLEQLFEKSFAELKEQGLKANAELKTLGETTVATKAAWEKLQKQVDAIDEKLQHKTLAETQEPLIDVLKANEDFQRIMRDKTGRATINLKGGHALQLGFHRKTTLTSSSIASVPFDTVGVLTTDRDMGIVMEARRALVIRDLLASRHTNAAQIAFVRVLNPMVNAQPQSPEGAAKYENALTFETDFERVKTIATWIPASRQLLDDWTELEGVIRTGLAYYVRKATEDQLLNGNGTGESLHGILPQATAFNTTLLPLNGAGSYTPIDIVGWAMGQIEGADEIEPSFVLLHPFDKWLLRMTKDTQGRYILGDPNSPNVPTIWGKTVVSSTAMSEGTFLVGTGDAAASEIRDRMDVTVEISTEHSDYFTKNLVAIRAEERLAYVMKRPGSFVKGSLTASPAA